MTLSVFDDRDRLEQENGVLIVRNRKKKKDLVFHCNECEFSTNYGVCLVKKFKCKHLPSFKDFGSMGDYS